MKKKSDGDEVIMESVLARKQGARKSKELLAARMTAIRTKLMDDSCPKSSH